MSTYHLQGAVPLGSDAYVERDFEARLIENTLADKWTTLLGPRQHGKTTSLIRIKNRIAGVGVNCILIDLQSMPPCSTYTELVEWFARRVCLLLNSDISNQPRDYEVGHLDAWLRSVLPNNVGPVTIIIDEASAIPNTEWRNSFYGQIRAIANERAMANPGELPTRLRFIFAGTFRPETLVNNLNSPFNVSEFVYTQDFTLTEALQLHKQVEDGTNSDFVRRAYDIVQGHPYLLQFILARAQYIRSLGDQVELDSILDELRFEATGHFESIFSPILSETELTELVSQMVVNGSVPNELNPNFRYLQVLGIAKREGTNLVFRNQLYLDFARNSSQIDQTRPVVNNASPIFTPLPEVYSFMKSNELREIASSMEQGAVRAHNRCNYRLALAGFGSALEAILIDWLSTLSPTDLSDAVRSAQRDRRNRLNFNTRYEDPNDPNTWFLVNLTKVARCTNTPINIDPPNALREWRNYIHPNVARQNYLPEQDLEPESRAASGLLAALRRDVAAII